MKKILRDRGITLIALIITIIILLILAGVAISSIGKNGLLSRANQSNEKQIKAEMKEQLILAINELQIEKEGNIKLDNITQEWANNKLKDYQPQITDDVSTNGKIVIMKKNNIIGKFLIDDKLNITEMDTSGINITYKTLVRNGENIEISIVITEKENGIKEITKPDGSILQGNGQNEIEIKCSIIVGQQYKVTVTSEDGKTKEEIIKIFDPLISFSEEESLSLEIEVKYPEINGLNIRKEYSINGTDYLEYTEKVLIKDNCTFYARVVNTDTNEIILSSQKNISNIAYEWEVWSSDEKTEYILNEDPNANSHFTGVKGYCIATSNAPTSNNTTIKFIMYDGYEIVDGKFVGTGIEYKYTAAQADNCVGKYIINSKNECAKVNRVWKQEVSMTTNTVIYPYLMTDCLLTIKEATVSTKGNNRYENVRSTNKEAYPKNDKSGEYWYVLIEK